MTFGSAWQRLLPLLATIALSLLCVLADFLLKQASQAAQPFKTTQFSLSLALYIVAAVGWVYVLRHMNLAAAGAIFSVVVVLCLAIVGIFAFQERLTTAEFIGLGCAIASLVLLGRFT
jgi:multidrug transporter EmrE-like cation transporter